MEFSFAIPRTNKDLLDADVSGYYVKNLYRPNEIPDKLRAAHQTLQQSDAFYIFDHFDAFFSVVENADKLQIKVLLRAVEILYKTTENLGQMLDGYLKQENLDRQHDFLNLLKMDVYLMVSTVPVIDVFVKENAPQNVGGGRKKTKQTNDDQLPYFASYDAKRYDVLLQLCNVMDMKIEKLFENSMVEESFVSMICDMAYRTLCHPSIKEKRVSDVVFQILGMAIKGYNHAMAFPVQIVQILEREEIAVVPIARCVAYLNDEFRITTVLNVLLKEFIERVDANIQTSLIPKHFSMFITEIGDLSPDLALECLQSADEILNLEPYNIRNSLFGVMGNVIITQLSGEGLSDEQREIRDELLEHLLEHVSDVNSYVRSKVLHIWGDLESKHAIPIKCKLRILQVAVERLEDKTATVRKNAITLLKLVLESNPFSCRLSLDEIQKKHDEAVEKRAIILEKYNAQEATREEIENDYKTRCIPELEVILEQLIPDEQAGRGVNMNGLHDDKDDDNGQKRVENIRNLLREGDFQTACRTIIHLDACNRDKRRPMSLQEQIIYFVYLFNTYLFDEYKDEIEKEDAVVGFLEDSLNFSKIISKAVPKLEYLLTSSTLTDVLEVIEFFKTGYLFNVKGCESGMKSMLRLLYINTGQDKNEKGEAVIRAYQAILFQTDLEGRAHHLKVVTKLCHFLQHISTGEYTAFELMIKHWIATKDIDVQIINVLFERFTMKLPDTTPNTARCCMELLILVSNAKPAVAQSNLNLITSILGSNRILRDPRIFTGCLKLLKNTQDRNDKASKGYVFIRRYEDKEVIDCVIENFKKFFFLPKLPHFETIASEAIDFLYRMCNTPDILSQDIIHSLCKKIHEISEKRKESAMDIGENGVESSQVTETYIPNYLLPRILFVFGCVASKELVYLDVDVYGNMKFLEELKREKKEKADSTNKRKSASNLNASASEALRRKSIANGGPNDPQEQDEAYMGATAEDSIAELINNICENVLITSEKGLFYHFVPILLEILSHPGKYTDPHVQCSAVLTLMRFMIVSGSFCADKIQFLMNIMKKSRNSAMKCNIIIGLADLTCRFANTIEPWISNFYEMLFEEDETIRLTTIKMLSYVILQAIVRVTGQLADMAICIVDTNGEIRNATKEFFRQLVASKEAEYYKILPDIISRLSSTDAPIEEEKFHIIMKYLMELIQKDRQVENLVEKLCVRFRNTSKERQWRDVAFCLALLNHNEKTMRKLIEHIGAYKDKIQHDEIYDSFKTIISNANKQITKGELKNMVKELDTKLQECLTVNENGDAAMQENRNDDDSDLADRSQASASQKQKKPTNKKGASKTKKKNRLDRFANMDSDDDDDSDENAPPARRKNTAMNSSTASDRPVRKGRRGPQISQSSDSDSEEEDRK